VTIWAASRLGSGGAAEASPVRAQGALRGAVEEVRPDLVGFGAAEVVQERERPPPCGRRGADVTGAPQHVPERDQGTSVAKAVAGPAVQRQRTPGMLDRLGVVAQVQVGGGQDGVRLAFQDPVSGTAGEGQGLPGVRHGMGVLATVPVAGREAEPRRDLRKAALAWRARWRARRW